MNTLDTVGRTELIRSLQIIHGALAAGLLLFLLVVVVILRAPLRALDPQAVISLAMAAVALMCVPGRLLVPGLIVNAGCQKIAGGIGKSPPRRSGPSLPHTDEGMLAQLFMTKAIVGAAMLEGAAFGNLVAYLLEGQIYSLILAVLGVVGILAAFPTRRGIDDWLERHLRRVQEIRHERR